MAFGLRELAQVLIQAEDKSQPAFDSLKRSISDVRGGVSSLQGMLAGIGVGLSAGGFALIIKNAIDATAALDDLQDTTALTVETLSSLQQTARIGGHSFETVTQTATKFAKAVAEAAGGNKELLNSFDALGISQQRLKDGKFDDLYTEFATKIANAENKTYAIAHATDLAGKSAAQAIPFFKDLAETGLEQSRVTKLQTAASDELQKQIGRMGNAFDGIVQKIAMQAVPVMSEWLVKVNSAYEATGNLATALAAMANLGQFGDTAVKQIESIDKALEKVNKQQGWFSGWIAQPLLGLRESGLLNARSVAAARLARQQIGAVNAGGLDGSAGDAPFRLRAPNSPASGNAATKDNAGLSLITQLENELANLNGTGTEVDKIIRKLTDGTAKYTLEVQAAALAIAGEIDEKKRLAAITKELAEAVDRAITVQDAADKVLAEFNKTQSEALQNLTFENQLMGLNETHRETAIALRKLEQDYQRASIQLLGEENDAYARRMAMTRGIYDAQRSALPAAVAANVVAKEALEANKKMVEEAKRSYDQLSESLTDALLRGFESGKGFAENFRDTLKNMFATLVLRPLIQPIAQGGAGMITGALGSLGIPGYANTSGGGIGSALSTGSNLSSMFGGGGGIGASIFGSSAAYGAALGTTSIGAGSQAAMLAAQTGVFGGAGLSATGTAAGSAMAGLSTAMPYIGLALAAYSVLKKDKGGPASFTGLDVSGTAGMGGMSSSNWIGNANNGKRASSWQSFDHGASAGINDLVRGAFAAVSYTHLTLPTNREV